MSKPHRGVLIVDTTLQASLAEEQKALATLKITHRKLEQQNDDLERRSRSLQQSLKIALTRNIPLQGRVKIMWKLQKAAWKRWGALKNHDFIVKTQSMEGD